MTKTEMVEELYKAGVGTKAALKKKSEEELDTLVAELTPKESEPILQPAIQVEEEKVAPEKTGSKGEPVLETKHQLGIFTEYMYHVKNVGAQVQVENLGGGDVYVGGEHVRVGLKDLRLVTLESKVFEGCTVLHMIAASQPEVKITELR